MLLAASATAVIVIAITFVYFVPTLGVIWTSQRAGLSGEEVAAKVNMWVMLNWARTVIMTIAWLFLLRAFGLSHQDSTSE